MYFLYADESGDVGTTGSPGQHFCLSGLVVHELRWHDTLEALIGLRRHLRDTYGLKLRALSRRMRRYNPVPKGYGHGSRAIPITTIVEDAVHRDSRHSFFIQTADVNAYFLKQYHQACGYVRRKGGKNYFLRLQPVLCTVASRSNPYGIVER